MLIRPRFDGQDLEKVRARAVELIRAAKDSDPHALVNTYGATFLFGGHPYGRPIGGEEAGLERLTREDVVRYHAEQTGADRLVLAVAGDFDPKDMKRRLARALAGMPKARAPLAAVPALEPEPGRRVLLVDKPDAVQTYFWIGNVGVSRRYDHRGALELANTVFGGRFTSMLNTELRIKSGLSYGARSALSLPSQPGSVAIVSFTRTDATVQAIDLALETLDRLRERGLDAAQLASAKQYLLGQYPLDLETAGQLAMQVAMLEFYGLGRAYIDGYAEHIAAVDLPRVDAVIEAVYPARDDLVFVLIGNASAIREQVARYGAVTEIPITAPRFSPP
jgi:predicted Zn-dependent peptidase